MGQIDKQAEADKDREAMERWARAGFVSVPGQSVEWRRERDVEDDDQAP
jgi:hypothetical protein